jgi:hypothetical protein
VTTVERKRAAIKGPLQEAFLKSPGVTLHVGDLSKDLGVTEQQVRNAIGGIRHHDDHWAQALDITISGRAWTYRPNTATTSRKDDELLFRLVGKASDGTLILEGTDQTLYRASVL